VRRSQERALSLRLRRTGTGPELGIRYAPPEESGGAGTTLHWRGLGLPVRVCPGSPGVFEPTPQPRTVPCGGPAPTPSETLTSEMLRNERRRRASRSETGKFAQGSTY